MSALEMTLISTKFGGLRSSVALSSVLCLSDGSTQSLPSNPAHASPSSHPCWGSQAKPNTSMHRDKRGVHRDNSKKKKKIRSTRDDNGDVGLNKDKPWHALPHTLLTRSSASHLRPITATRTNGTTTGTTTTTTTTPTTTTTNKSNQKQ